jgi:uncharacterized protein (DUF1684 family)
MSELDDFRVEKDEHFKHSDQSPLTREQRQSFAGLSYFPENPALRLEVTVEEFDPKPAIEMPTSTGDVRRFTKHGRFTFTVDGQPATLTLYAADYGYFLPFVDALANTETYGAGRYLEPEPLGGGRFLVDFNFAYNPYCAYNDAWSCPLTPFENHVKVPIRAGEKDFPDATHEYNSGIS